MVAADGTAQHTPPMQQLTEVAARLAAKGKGLLASDESIGTIGKRIEKAGLANTEVRQASLLRQTRSVHTAVQPVVPCRRTGAATERASIRLT